MPITFGALMRQLRRAQNLSLEDTGKALNLSTSYLSLIENDERPAFSGERLEKLAMLFRVPALLLQEVARAGKEGVTLDADMFPHAMLSTRSSCSDGRSLALKRLDGLPRRIYGRAAEGLYKHDPGLRAKHARTYAEIEKQAELLRIEVFEYLGVPIRYDAAFPVTELLDCLEAKGPQSGGNWHKVRWQRTELPASIEAFTRYEPHENAFMLCVSPETDRNLRKGHGRSRFTVSHEAAHLRLHAEELKELSDDGEPVKETDFPSFESVEWQANAFAGALLAPATGIQSLIGNEKNPKDLTPDEEMVCIEDMRKQFKVSYAAAEKRWTVFKARPDELLAAARSAAK